MTKIIRIKGKRVRPGQILLAIGMILVAMIMIAPFLWVFSASLRTFSDATALPPKWLPPALGEWNMKYFDKLCSGQIPFFTFMRNSLKISTIITAGMVCHGALAGYAYARLSFKGKNVMFGLMLVGMMVPVQVTIVPLFKIMNLLGVINTAACRDTAFCFWSHVPGICGCIWNIYDETVFYDGAG